MKPAPIPENDAERLAALRALDILDTPREERFDRLVRLACALLKVPIAAVSLVDEARQWFKASEGLDVSETGRDISFCGHGVVQGTTFVVGDAGQDPRFADNPLVAGAPGVRAYAGEPLSAPDGHKVGMLCAIDVRPRRFDEKELQILRDLASLVERELHLEELVSLQRRARDAEQSAARRRTQLAEFFSLSLDMLCIADTKGYFRRLNPSWSKNLGWTEDELMARPYLDFVHPDDQDATLVEAEGLSQGGRTVSFENRYRHVDGSWRHLLWNAVKSDEEDLIYAIARDVTEERRMETMKNEFVSTVSHELRTPLTSIRGALDLVAGGVAGTVSDEAGQMLGVARSNCERLSLLINDILDMEKIESGRMDFRLERHDVGAIVEAAIRENERFASQHGVRFALARRDDGVVAQLDPARLHQVLGNLLSNAAKFAPEGSEVKVTVERRGSGLRVSVADRGPGIPDSQQARIFEKFVQIDSSSTREKGGTGLGLAISRAIVERMGGSIGVESTVGEGSRFWFCLPVSDPVPLRGAPLGARRILICDDDEDVVNALREVVEGAGFACDVAGSVAEAKAKLAEFRYDAVTLDLVLPDATGVELLRELRADETTANVPVVVVSASVETDRQQLEGSAIGVIDWIDTPLDEERLLRAIEGARSARPRPRVLHVEDDLDVQLIVGRVLADVADVTPVASLSAARRALAQGEFDLVLLDLRLPDGDGNELLTLIGALDRPIPVVVFSAYDVADETARSAAAVLLKSRTSNLALRDTILSHVGRPEVVGA